MPDDAELTRAVEEYLAALEAGQPLDRQAFVACHPEIADALAECLEGLEFIQHAGPALHQSAVEVSAKASASVAAIQPEGPLGDFRIVREIGRGGMGVVYEAVQISLGRRVALKVLPLAAALDTKQLQRFKNEAQAAANLHHTNIVPVHAVGCERGVHYYAMQFIDGQTLAAVIRDLQQQAGLEAGDAPVLPATIDSPSAHPGSPASPVAETARQPQAALSTLRSGQDAAFFRTVATWGMQAAEALEHAHDQGVIHRDIKPANLLLDGKGNLWITDFGLAHCQSNASLTLSGDLVGTLRYMSPEQALGKRSLVDHRSDLYSLGATLYELLTLHVVFDGRDREELLRQITLDEPRSLRHWNRTLPHELETIVLKAMEK